MSGHYTNSCNVSNVQMVTLCLVGLIQPVHGIWLGLQARGNLQLHCLWVFLQPELSWVYDTLPKARSHNPLIQNHETYSEYVLGLGRGKHTKLMRLGSPNRIWNPNSIVDYRWFGFQRFDWIDDINFRYNSI